MFQGNPPSWLFGALRGAVSSLWSEVQIEGDRFSGKKMPRCGVEDAYLVALCKQIQELQAENEDFLSCRAENTKMQMPSATHIFSLLTVLATCPVNTLLKP